MTPATSLLTTLGIAPRGEGASTGPAAAAPAGGAFSDLLLALAATADGMAETAPADGAPPPAGGKAARPGRLTGKILPPDLPPQLPATLSTRSLPSAAGKPGKGRPVTHDGTLDTQSIRLPDTAPSEGLPAVDAVAMLPADGPAQPLHARPDPAAEAATVALALPAGSDPDISAPAIPGPRLASAQPLALPLAQTLAQPLAPNLPNTGDPRQIGTSPGQPSAEAPMPASGPGRIAALIQVADQPLGKAHAAADTVPAMAAAAISGAPSAPAASGSHRDGEKTLPDHTPAQPAPRLAPKPGMAPDQPVSAPAPAPVIGALESPQMADATQAVRAPHPLPAQSGQDLTAILDRLAAAREALAPATAALSIDHQDFGALSLRFEQRPDGGLAVQLAAADPEAHRAIEAAVAAEGVPQQAPAPENSPSSGAAGQRGSQASGQPGAQQRDPHPRGDPDRRTPADARQAAADHRPADPDGIFA